MGWPPTDVGRVRHTKRMGTPRVIPLPKVASLPGLPPRDFPTQAFTQHACYLWTSPMRWLLQKLCSQTSSSCTAPGVFKAHSFAFVRFVHPWPSNIAGYTTPRFLLPRMPPGTWPQSGLGHPRLRHTLGTFQLKFGSNKGSYRRGLPTKLLTNMLARCGIATRACCKRGVVRQTSSLLSLSRGFEIYSFALVGLWFPLVSTITIYTSLGLKSPSHTATPPGAWPPPGRKCSTGILEILKWCTLQYLQFCGCS
jgi:hypothetical protein